MILNGGKQKELRRRTLMVDIYLWIHYTTDSAASKDIPTRKNKKKERKKTTSALRVAPGGTADAASLGQTPLCNSPPLQHCIKCYTKSQVTYEYSMMLSRISFVD